MERYGRGYNSGGYCICLKCGKKVPHERSVPCRDMRCPNCNSALVREGSYHHELFLKKQKEK